MYKEAPNRDAFDFQLQRFNISTRYEEAFPKAEQLFREAFALPDPAPKLLGLVKAHPTYDTIMNLLLHYTVAVQDNPYRANTLALALKAVGDSPDAPTIDGDTLLELFYRELADLHSRGFDSASKGFVPTNTFLITSLLSGLSIKYDLTDSSDQYGNIWENLDVHSSTSEDGVIGACIQLLTSGSIIVQFSKSYIDSANEATTKIKAQKSKGAVKDPNATRFLEVGQSLMK